MTRLHTELHRLYDLDATGSVRHMVIELSRPADWRALSQLWHGVQAELDLPPPAIAVNGVDGYQLWFSLAEALPLVQAHEFAQALCAHYLDDVAPERVTVHPSADLLTVEAPPQAKSSDQWSAFVAPDLAPVFSETPWLDVQPSLDGQADLLSGLKSIAAKDLGAALRHLPSPSHGNPGQANEGAPPASAPPGVDPDPKAFLIEVMRNGAIAMNLRIEAAKALLPYFHAPR